MRHSIIFLLYASLLHYLNQRKVHGRPLKLLEWLSSTKTVEKHLYIDEYYPGKPFYVENCPALVHEFIQFLSNPNTVLLRARAAQMMQLVDMMYTMKPIENPKPVCDPVKGRDPKEDTGDYYIHEVEEPCGCVDIVVKKIFLKMDVQSDVPYRFHKFMLEVIITARGKRSHCHKEIFPEADHDKRRYVMDYEYKVEYLAAYKETLTGILFLTAYEYERVKELSHKEIDELVAREIFEYKNEYTPKDHAFSRDNAKDNENREELRKSELENLFGEFERITHKILYIECILHYGNKVYEKDNRHTECLAKSCKSMRASVKQPSIWDLCPTII